MKLVYNSLEKRSENFADQETSDRYSRMNRKVIWKNVTLDICFAKMYQKIWIFHAATKPDFSIQ